MKQDPIKKFMLIMILVALMFGLVIWLLPVDTVYVGYSSENGIGSPIIRSKMEGILILLTMPFLSIGFYYADPMSCVKTEKNRKKQLPYSKYFYLILSMLGPMAMLINLFIYLF